MSRHRRQRNKRWQQTVASADPKMLDYGFRAWVMRNQIPKLLSQLERLLVSEYIQTEQGKFQAALDRKVLFRVPQ